MHIKPQPWEQPAINHRYTWHHQGYDAANLSREIAALGGNGLDEGLPLVWDLEPAHLTYPLTQHGTYRDCMHHHPHPAP